jgi:hypothetical protein
MDLGAGLLYRPKLTHEEWSASVGKRLFRRAAPSLACSLARQPGARFQPPLTPVNGWYYNASTIASGVRAIAWTTSARLTIPTSLPSLRIGTRLM